jgi:hypothetical protein
MHSSHEIGNEMQPVGREKWVMLPSMLLKENVIQIYDAAGQPVKSDLFHSMNP